MRRPLRAWALLGLAALTLGWDDPGGRFTLPLAPDWVVWIYDDANSSGGRPFGVDDERGAATARFVWDHCVEVVVYGAAPWEDGGYGAAALRCGPNARSFIP